MHRCAFRRMSVHSICVFWLLAFRIQVLDSFSVNRMPKPGASMHGRDTNDAIDQDNPAAAAFELKETSSRYTGEAPLFLDSYKSRKLAGARPIILPRTVPSSASSELFEKTYSKRYLKKTSANSFADTKVTFSSSLMHGPRITLNLPMNQYVVLFQQNDLAVLAQGDETRLPGEQARNRIHSMIVRIGSTDIVRVDQKQNPHAGLCKGLVYESIAGEVSTSPLQKNSPDAQPECAILNVSILGREHRSRDTTLLLRRETSLNSDVEIGVEQDLVTVRYGDLKVVLQSIPLGSGAPQRALRQLDVLVPTGLDAEKASGVLPELWGLQPVSEEVGEMLKEHSNSKRAWKRKDDSKYIGST